MTRFIEVTCKKTGRPTLIGIDAIRNIGGWDNAQIQIGDNIYVETVESYEEVREIVNHVERGMITNKDSWVR